jgi:hypothetical protein
MVIKIPPIEIYNYTDPVIIKNNKNEILKKFEFLSYDNVEELIKGNLYDDLELRLEQPINDANIKSPIAEEQDKIIKEVRQMNIDIVSLKSAKVIDYEPPYSLDDGTIVDSHKYTIVTQDIRFKKEPFEIDTDYRGK